MKLTVSFLIANCAFLIYLFSFSEAGCIIFELCLSNIYIYIYIYIYILKPPMLNLLRKATINMVISSVRAVC